MKTLTLLIFTLSSILCSGQQYSKKWSDINYAGDDMGYHLLDIYLPKITKQAYPVVIYIYGSGWYHNDLKGKAMSTLGSALLDAGYAVVTPNHRSSSDTVYPAQIHDIKATIRFIRAKSSEYQLDTSFVGIMGSSSGGHMASIVGTTNNIWQYTIDTITMGIEGNLGNYDNVSSDVDAVCDWFGGSDFLLNMDSSSCGSSFDLSDASSLIGGPVQDNPIKCALANPITYVDPTDPPFLIIHGDADQEVSYCESEALFNALQLAGVKSEFILVPGGQHGSDLYTYITMPEMVDFFNEISGNISNINEIQNNHLKIFPNPVNSTLKITNITDAEITLYAVTGAVQRNLHLAGGENNEIDLSMMEPGIYILKVRVKEGVKFFKFIKE